MVTQVQLPNFQKLVLCCGLTSPMKLWSPVAKLSAWLATGGGSFAPGRRHDPIGREGTAFLCLCGLVEACPAPPSSPMLRVAGGPNESSSPRVPTFSIPDALAFFELDETFEWWISPSLVSSDSLLEGCFWTFGEGQCWEASSFTEPVACSVAAEPVLFNLQYKLNDTEICQSVMISTTKPAIPLDKTIFLFASITL